MFLVQILREPGAVLHDLLHDAFLRIMLILLFQEGYPYILEEHDLSARVGFVLSRQNPHQRSLSRTVRGYQGYLVPFVDVEADMLEEDLRSV